jgi:RNA polymerase sigma-70 factor, ECF subfamily
LLPTPHPHPLRDPTVSRVPVSNPAHVTTRAATAIQYANRVDDRDETRLIARVLAGDRRAGRELYDAHAPRVYRLVYRLCGDDDLAQEFTQEAFIRAFDRLDRFRGESALSTWLHRIAVTVTANGMRKVRRLRDREAEIDPDFPAGPGLDGLQRSEPDLRARLAAAIDALPEIYRTTLVMHDIEGYTHTEIASILDVAEGTCKSRLSVARAQLRRVLAPFSEEQS